MKPLPAILISLFLTQIPHKSESACVSETFNLTLVRVCNKQCIVQQIDKCISKENVSRDTKTIQVLEKIKKLRRGAFKDLKNLTMIRVDRTDLEEIQPNCFVNLPQATTLIADTNRLQEVTYGVFNGVNFATVGLSNNTIATIDHEAFANMPNLKFLNLNFNKLTEFNQNWFGLDNKLETLYLSYNLIRSLAPNGFKNLKNLRHLALRANVIKRIDAKVFYGKRYFGSIDFGYNHMEYVHPDIFEHQTNITVLNLALNDFKFLPGDFFGNIFIKELFLQPNPWLCECLNEIHDKLRRRGGIVINPSEDVEIKWKESYPVCLVVDSESAVSCNEDFVKSVKNDMIFKDYFSKLKYDTILLD